MFSVLAGWSVAALQLALAPANAVHAQAPASLAGMTLRWEYYTPMGDHRSYQEIDEFRSDGSYTVRLRQGWRSSQRWQDAAVDGGTYRYALNDAGSATLELWRPGSAMPAAGFDFSAFQLTFAGPTTGIASTLDLFGHFSLEPTGGPGTHTLANVSTLLSARKGIPQVLGFVVGGSELREVLIRVVGPGLAPLGVTGWASAPDYVVSFPGRAFAGPAPATPPVWSDPAIPTGTMESEFARVGAFALPAGSADKAEWLLLPPGAYTISINPSSAAAEGMTLVEVYEVP